MSTASLEQVAATLVACLPDDMGETTADDLQALAELSRRLAGANHEIAGAFDALAERVSAPGSMTQQATREMAELRKRSDEVDRACLLVREWDERFQEYVRTRTRAAS
jgi:hypothetical protein